jgi:glycosyltransferase involved in cell wall biosynthesis
VLGWILPSAGRISSADVSLATRTLSDDPAGPPHVAILTAEFPPVGGGGVIRVAKLVKYLSELGWRVTVVTSDEHLANAYDESLLDEIPHEVTVIRAGRALATIGGSAVARRARERLGRTSTIIRVLRGTRDAIRSVWAIPDHRLPWALSVARWADDIHPAPDAIISTGPPHSVHVGGTILARRLRVPHVIDLRDEWTLRPLTKSRLPWRSLVERRLEAWSLRRAGAVVVVSDESRARYAEAYPELEGRLNVIPNGFDPEDLAGLDASPRAADGPLTLGYAGSFQAGTPIAPMFAAIGHAVRHGVEGRAVRFEMVGPFLPHHVQEARERVPADGLSIKPFTPHRKVLRLMAEWDGLCVIANDGAASLAGKLYECLALRRPVVVIAPEGPATRLVRELEAGAVANPNDVASISDAIATALRMAPTFEGVSDDRLAPYDRRRQAERWSQLLRTLIERTPTRRAG